MRGCFLLKGTAATAIARMQKMCKGKRAEAFKRRESLQVGREGRIYEN